MSSVHMKLAPSGTNHISPYMSRKNSMRSHSSDGQKLKAPRVSHNSRTILMANPPTVPATPPVCHKPQQQHQNLTNLRDILRVSHQQERLNVHNMNKVNMIMPRNTANHSSMHEINRGRNVDNPQLTSNEKISKIERDLQESLRILKQYNDNSLNETLLAHTLDNRSSFNYGQHQQRQSYRHASTNNSMRVQYNKHQAHFVQRNMSHSSADDRAKIINRPIREVNQIQVDFEKTLTKNSEKPKQHQQQQVHISNIEMRISTAESILRETDICGPSSPEKIQNKELGGGGDVELEGIAPRVDVGPKPTEFLGKFSSQLNASKKEENTDIWNYDELNDLRMRFISLLAPEKLNEKDTNPTTPSKNLPSLMEESAENNQLQQLEHEKHQKTSTSLLNTKTTNLNPQKASSLLQPLTVEEQSKIESFYSSYGTSIYTSGSCACLYTMSNLKSSTVLSDLDYSHRMVKPAGNRTSMAIGPSNLTLKSQQTRIGDIDPEVIKDFMTHKYQNHVSVYHRGVPLWLFNSGTNPRRPCKQMKFTLAEKGTGFILWQDRIDACSDFKLYAQRKSDQKIVNYTSYRDKLEVANASPNKGAADQSSETFSSMLVTFRASDKKTTVFIKFDMNSHAAKFFDYYADITLKLAQEVRQRTKSLPAGVNISINNRAFNFADTKGGSEVVKRPPKSLQNQANSTLKRQSYFGQMMSRQKRISKHDISLPSNVKHVIKLNPSDRNSYYTLSKLLPVSVCTSLSISSSSANESMVNSSHKSSPSPTYSSSSASSLSFSSAGIKNKNNLDMSSQSRDTWDPKNTSSSKVCSSNRSSASSSSISISSPFTFKHFDAMNESHIIDTTTDNSSDSKNNSKFATQQAKRFELAQPGLRLLQQKKAS